MADTDRLLAADYGPGARWLFVRRELDTLRSYILTDSYADDSCEVIDARLDAIASHIEKRLRQSPPDSESLFEKVSEHYAVLEVLRTCTVLQDEQWRALTAVLATFDDVRAKRLLRSEATPESTSSGAASQQEGEAR